LKPKTLGYQRITDLRNSFANCAKLFAHSQLRSSVIGIGFNELLSPITNYLDVMAGSY